MGARQRIRAAKACQRCSRRKVKCDATQTGVPCSRCRQDKMAECTLVSSRRGTYDRRNFRRPRPPPASAPASAATDDTPLVADSVLSTTSADSSDRQSLSCMFEDFLGRAGHEDLCKAKLVLFGEPSPLTFALQLRRDPNSGLHDASQGILSSDTLTVVDENIHPKHLPQHDITCLEAKGAFIYPEAQIVDEVISVFLNRFYPLYSMVNPVDLRKAQQERKLPWILLHSICFIAMTFCDPPLIYKAGFVSRAQARQVYYDRAKALFDLNYENSKIILVKVAILLSFKGPQMDCYWNPCSWIEVGVTMAVAMGMHRKAVTANANSNDRGLLRRIWWVLAIRDAHCSALLGRPFRINTTQCDIDMLTLQDFPDEHGCQASMENGACECRTSYEYQVCVGKLSHILRSILFFRFGPASNVSSIDALQAQLIAWKAELPTTMQRINGQFPVSNAAIQLDILFNYHIILLHMEQPWQSRFSESFSPHTLLDAHGATANAEAAALAISSSAINLITRTSICNLPHEVFPGFFVAGIILYQQVQQAQQSQNSQLARLIRASFDNCQMFLNQAQSTWDPGVWASKVFEFLLSAADAANAAATAGSGGGGSGTLTQLGEDSSEISFRQSPTWADVPGMELDRGFAIDMADYMLFPNFFTPPLAD
ncbi:hypothetical protein BDV09DRAFT_190424 [Aspergillus tetrazonus]